MTLKPNILLVYTITFVVLLLPIISNSFLPLVDISNHAARHYVASALADDTTLSSYYSYTINWFGNSASDILRSLLGDHISVYNFARVTIGLYTVNLVFSVCVLNRVLNGSWGWWPLASVLVVYNGNYLWGFESFLLGSPLVIYGTAILLGTANRPFAQRFIAISLITSALFISHTLLGLIFALVVFGYEFQRMLEQNPGEKIRYFGRNIMIGLPFLVLIILFMVSKSGGENTYGSYSEYGNFLRRFDTIVSVVAENADGLVLRGDTPSKIGSLVLVFGFVYLSARRSGPRLRIDPRMKGVLATLLLALFCVPSWVDGVAFVDYRIPFLLVSIFIASTRLTDFSRFLKPAFIMTILVVCCGRIYGEHRLASQHSEEIVGLQSLLGDLPVGAKIMPIFGEKDRQLWRYHSTAIAVIEKQALIPTMFQGQHGLTVKDQWANYATPTVPAVSTNHLRYSKETGKYAIFQKREYKYMKDRPIYHDNWEEKFEYVLLLNRTENDLLRYLPLKVLGSSGAYTLYKNTELSK